MHGTPQVSFRIGDGRLADELEERGIQIGQVAKRDLLRYYTVLEMALHSLPFTPDELPVIVDEYSRAYGAVSEDDAFNVAIIQYRPHAVADTLRENGNTVTAAKLLSLTPLQRMALADAIERYRTCTSLTDTMQSRLIKVGLIRAVTVPA